MYGCVWVCVDVCTLLISYVSTLSMYIMPLTSLTECFDDSENHFIISQIKLRHIIALFNN